MKVKSKRGFTLIETILTVGIFGIITMVIVTVLVTSLRSALKTDLSNRAKQVGNTLLTVMSRYLHNATSINSCSNNIVAYTKDDGSSASFECKDNDGNPGNGYETIWSSGAVVLNSVYSVNELCQITCVGTPPKEVQVKFIISRGAPNGNQYEKISIPFQTSITLRN